jgi:hypothetical protein
MGAKSGFGVLGLALRAFVKGLRMPRIVIVTHRHYKV